MLPAEEGGRGGCNAVATGIGDGFGEETARAGDQGTSLLLPHLPTQQQQHQAETMMMWDIQFYMCLQNPA